MYTLRKLQPTNLKGSDWRFITIPGGDLIKYDFEYVCAGYLLSVLLTKWDRHGNKNLRAWDAYFNGKYNDGYVGPRPDPDRGSIPILVPFGQVWSGIAYVKAANISSLTINGQQFI